MRDVNFLRSGSRWAVRECPVQHYSEVYVLGPEEQVFFVLDFQLTFSFLVVDMEERRKTANTAFVVLSFNFQVWRYFPTVAMSLLSTLSTVCQSPSACMVARTLVQAYVLETVFGKSEV